MADPVIFDASDETAFLETQNEFSWDWNIGNGEEGNNPAEHFPRDRLTHLQSRPKPKGTVSLSTPAVINGLYPSDESYDPILNLPESLSCQSSSYGHNLPPVNGQAENFLKRPHEDEAWVSMCIMLVLVANGNRTLRMKTRVEVFSTRPGRGKSGHAIRGGESLRRSGTSTGLTSRDFTCRRTSLCQKS